MQRNHSQFLQNLSIENLTPMQEEMLGSYNTHNNIILLSPTGSGKTVGFLLPLIQCLEKDKEGIQALILAPSRELAVQIEQVFKKFACGYKVNSCYG